MVTSKISQAVFVAAAVFLGGCGSSGDATPTQVQTTQEQETVEQEIVEQEEAVEAVVSDEITVSIYVPVSNENLAIGDSSQVKISDGGGNLLGVGTMTWDGVKEFHFVGEIPNVKRSPDGFYKFEVAAIEGDIVFTESDLRKDVLRITSIP